MRYFDSKLVANSRHHAKWWLESSVMREFFHNREQELSAHMGPMLDGPILANAATMLPRDAWLDIDTATRRVIRLDEGTFMGDLMALAKTVHIGKLAHISRVSTDVNDQVVISMSGQIAEPVDKVDYDYRGAPVPIFSKAYGREWREWNTLQSENFDALLDDQEATTDKIRKAQARYAVFGNPRINVGGYEGFGIMNHPLTKLLNLGTGAGGTNINLTTADGDALDAFFSAPFGAMLDANGVVAAVNLVVSPEIARNWDRSYSGASGFKGGRIIDFLNTNRRINKVTVDHMLSGNQFFGYVPSSEFIRPLVGMAVTTHAVARMNPTDNYQFKVMGAMGLEIRGDANGKSGVFASVEIN